ncbi:NAD(P)-binding protein [Rhypophila decipiens]|uniref:3-dehydrosphinganine reductase n=1 Tax=Rhypophila decipiens TaxID=261697 RepID=A0AAN7B230_9PEZI|nr:NAD(P)-binding protein [Rhypophila decipiens]
MGGILTTNQFPVNGRTVLVTGGSSGLGFSAAKQLAEKGANVVIVARTKTKLQEAIQELKKAALSATQRFHYIPADVTTPEDCSRVISETTAWNNGSPPEIVWCCSGSAHPTLFIDTPVDKFQTMMDSNYFSSVYMAHAILNLWLRPSPSSSSAASEAPSPSPVQKQEIGPSRHLIFTASFVSFFSFAGFTPYSPSKAAIRSLSDSLSQEMNLYAGAYPTVQTVKIHTVFPATMPTRSLDDENLVKSDLTKSLEEDDIILSPDECARRAILGLESGQELVTTSVIIRAVMAASLGGSRRFAGGLIRGLADTVLAWVVVVVMVFVRWDMDRKVRAWGRRFGASGKKMLPSISAGGDGQATEDDTGKLSK